MAGTRRQAHCAEAGVRLGCDSDVSQTDTWSSARRVRADSGSLRPRGTAWDAGPPPRARDAGAGGEQGARGPSARQLLTVLQEEGRAGRPGAVGGKGRRAGVWRERVGWAEVRAGVPVESRGGWAAGGPDREPSEGCGAQGGPAGVLPAEDEDILVPRALMVEQLLHLQGQGLARPQAARLAEPALADGGGAGGGGAVGAGLHGGRAGGRRGARTRDCRPRGAAAQRDQLRPPPAPQPNERRGRRLMAGAGPSPPNGGAGVGARLLGGTAPAGLLAC